jgi:hypothetical protein
MGRGRLLGCWGFEGWGRMGRKGMGGGAKAGRRGQYRAPAGPVCEGGGTWAMGCPWSPPSPWNPRHAVMPGALGAEPNSPNSPSAPLIRRPSPHQLVLPTAPVPRPPPPQRRAHLVERGLEQDRAGRRRAVRVDALLLGGGRWGREEGLGASLGKRAGAPRSAWGHKRAPLGRRHPPPDTSRIRPCSFDSSVRSPAGRTTCCRGARRARGRRAPAAAGAQRRAPRRRCRARRGAAPAGRRA